MATKNKSIDKSDTSKDHSIGTRLCYLRGLRGFSQDQLAKKAGVSQSSVAHIERDAKDPSVKTLKKLADALDVSPAVFFVTDDLLVFDMAKLEKKYKSAQELNPTMHKALWRVVNWAKAIRYIT